MTTRRCVSIPIPAYLRDHVVSGQSVLPAAEALQLLALDVKRHFPAVDVYHTSDARFLRFVPLSGEQGTLADSVDALIELSPMKEDCINASLLTTQQTKVGLQRTREHVSVCFGKAKPNISLPVDDALCLEGVCTVIPKTLLYGEMVPFGPSFHNAVEPIRFSRSGATAWLQAPELGSPDATSQTGSAFVFDAALHLACGWSQYAFGIVPFPTGYARRQIHEPTRPGEHYYGAVIPKGHAADRFLFDILIFDSNGDIRESTSNLIMQDIFHGRTRAPTDLKPLGREFEERLTALCPTIAIVELDALYPFAAQAIVGSERERLRSMASRRRAAFCGGRAALRIAARRFMETRGLPLSTNIETGSHENGAPWVRWPLMPESCSCAVSHDSRFAVALFDERPIGIDVEQLGDKAYRNRRLFLSEHERTTVDTATLDRDQSALRAWSIKEAAVKMFLQPLGTLWKSLTIRAIGSEESSFEFRGTLWNAQHANFDDHLVTVITSPTT